MLLWILVGVFLVLLCTDGRGVGPLAWWCVVMSIAVLSNLGAVELVRSVALSLLER